MSLKRRMQIQQRKAQERERKIEKKEDMYTSIYSSFVADVNSPKIHGQNRALRSKNPLQSESDIPLCQRILAPLRSSVREPFQSKVKLQIASRVSFEGGRLK